MLEKHDARSKYTLDVINNGEIRHNNNVLKTELNGIHHENNESSEYSKKTFRNALPQILATCAKNLLLLTYGMTLGVGTIAIPALEANKNFANMSEEIRKLRTDTLTLNESQVSWFSSINLICVPLGCFISGAVTQPLGRKRSMMALNVPFFIVWVLYYNANSVATLYAALIISGLAGGLHEAPVLTYVAEITEPHLRGMLGSTAPTTVIIGTVSQLILGRFYHWRTVVFFNMFFPIIAFTALCFVPESPHWLISNSKFEEAEKSLCWLRGWVSPEQVQQEFALLKKSIQIRQKRRKSIREIIDNYTRRTFIIPHLIVIGTFMTAHFGGMMSVQTNAVKLFTILGTPVDEYTSTLILGVVDFAGAVLCVILVHWTGKRKLLISTTAGCAVCLFTLSLYDYCRVISLPLVQHLTWVPIVFLNVNAFLVHAGIRLLPWVLIGEMYPTEIRATASGASALWFYVFAFAANKSFYWLLKTIKIFGLLGLYGVFIGLGSVFFYFMLPETEGVTLYEIEKHFSHKENLFKTRIRKRLCNSRRSSENLRAIDVESHL